MYAVCPKRNVLLSHLKVTSVQTHIFQKKIFDPLFQPMAPGWEVTEDLTKLLGDKYLKHFFFF